ncbi:Hint domain-containing protein [Entomobacter blattae]|uniref:Hint domain protein n=1 Tax=Entomobacter blattae TaxID=2762277 RepID=A0A7H1NTQ4_9PROT|nr:Hint domain-containing protein [Entomobacter blattae]QNT79164.1 Hint domain protein [Entomobacter blattae]
MADSKIVFSADEPYKLFDNTSGDTNGITALGTVGYYQAGNVGGSGAFVPLSANGNGVTSSQGSFNGIRRPISYITIHPGEITEVGGKIAATITFSRPANGISSVEVYLKYTGYTTVAGTTALGFTYDSPVTSDANAAKIANDLATKFNGTSWYFSPTVTNSQVLNVQSPVAEVVSADVCFLAGTEIKVPGGIKLVEDVAVGDMVVTVKNGIEVAQQVVAVSHSTVAAVNTESQPVCIKKDAFADGVPYQDLFVTGEHCVFVGGKLVLARMLVNGVSIVRGDSFSRYEIYHVELSEHAVLVSNGLTTESYLDTNHNITQNGNIVHLGRKTWEKDAVAPLGTEKAFAESIYNVLLERANQLGLKSEQVAVSYVTDPDLHLLTDSGNKVSPCKVKDNEYFFIVPKVVKSARLVSRTFVPAEVEGSFIDDRRTLGVLVSDVSVCWSATRKDKVSSCFSEDMADGWYPMDHEHSRWTNGDAHLSLVEISDENTKENAVLISIKISSSGKYKTITEVVDNKNELLVS